tara:strand:- start:215 stop:397 length:183 start_codon:yes stop_codon:yes gene_type:complete
VRSRDVSTKESWIASKPDGAIGCGITKAAAITVEAIPRLNTGEYINFSLTKTKVTGPSAP